MLLLAVSLSTLAGASVSAQCGAPHWAPGYGALGPDGPVYAAAFWDPDGPGPLPQRLVVGGDFATVGGLVVHNIASRDPVTGEWTAFAGGFDGVVRAIHVRPNGDLIVGGDFIAASGLTVNGIARWSGTAWTDLAGGLPGFVGYTRVRALASMPNGDLLAGGDTSMAPLALGLARWNGVAWSSLGAPGSVSALAVLPNGDIVAAGSFQQLIPSTTYYRVGLRTASGWSPLSSLSPTTPSEDVSALAVLTNGDVVAGGGFSSLGGVAANNVARWNASGWSAYGTGVTGSVRCILPIATGGFVVGGNLQTAGGVAVDNFARWYASGWGNVGGVTNGTASAPFVYTMAPAPSGGLVLGGTFDLAGGLPAAGLATWDGLFTVAPLGLPTDGKINAVAALPDGQLLVGGEFTRIWNVPANRVALWTGSEWQALGTGVNNTVDAVARLPNGELVAGGTFTQAGGVAVNRIARWNGTSWAPLGSGAVARVRALTVRYNELFVGGDFSGGMRVWDGTGWSIPGGSGSLTGSVWALATLPNGDVVAGGQLTFVGATPAGRIARWNGAAWSPMGTGMNNTVLSLHGLPNGDVVAGGLFTTAGGGAANRVARWDGMGWSAMGAGFPSSVRAIGTLPGGAIVVGGEFASSGGVPLDHIARWNGASWDPVDGGMPGSTSNVWALATMASGELVAGGQFATAGGAYSPNLARLVADCPAGAVSYGNACGPHVLVAQSPPWLGTTFVTQTTCTSPCIPVMVTGGAQASVPLALLYPQGLPGCNLLVTPDILTVVTPIFGQVFGYVALPNTPSLAGLSFYQQVVEVRLDLTGAFTQLASTNALEVTIGSY